MSKYLVKKRSVEAGAYNPFGRSLRYGKWETTARCDTLPQAQDELSKVTGLMDRAIFFKGKRLE